MVKFYKKSSAKLFSSVLTFLLIFGGFSSTYLYGTQYMTSRHGYSFGLASGADWWDCNWSYCKKIIIDHTKVDATQTNFPVLLYEGADSDLATHAQADGDDIVFVDQFNSSQLDHELEGYNSETGELIAWVEVPTLSHTSDTILYIFKN